MPHSAPEQYFCRPRFRQSGTKIILQCRHLQREACGFIESKIPSLEAQPSERKPEENPPAKKTEKEEKKGLCLNLGKKTEPEEDNNFKSAFSPRFQTGAVNNKSSRRRT